MNLVHFQLGYLIIKRKTQISRDFKNDYTDEFKRMAVDQYQKGKSPVEIFTEAQIDVRIIGSKNAFNLVKKWIKEQDKRLNKSQNTKLSIEQQLKEAQARIKYLEEELDFRKKLQALEEK